MAVGIDAITGFTDNNVFADAKLNIACNRICTLIDQENGGLLTVLFSGDASRIYQGLEPLGDVGAVTFKTAVGNNIRIILSKFAKELVRVRLLIAVVMGGGGQDEACVIRCAIAGCGKQHV